MKTLFKYIVFTLLVIGCDILSPDSSNPEFNKTEIKFRNLISDWTVYQLRVVDDEFYVIREFNELEAVSKKYINGTDDHFFTLFKDFNFKDSTIIGYTTAARTAAFFRTDSIFNFNDTLKIFYTYNLNTAFQDVPNLSSIVAVKKTDLPITIGDIIFIH